MKLDMNGMAVETAPVLYFLISYCEQYQEDSWEHWLHVIKNSDVWCQEESLKKIWENVFM
jgi:hypothetical protein